MNVSTLPVASLTVGGRVFTDLTNLIIIHCGTAGSNTYSTGRRPNATSGYQVPASRTLRVAAMKIAYLSSTGSGTNIGLGYADNDAGLDVAVGSLTNPVHCAGSTAVPVMGAGRETGYFAADKETALDFTVPTGKYVFSRGNTVAMTLYGYLE